MSKRLDLIGQRFGKLEVKELGGVDKHGQSLWKCLCDCGNYTNVYGYSLKSGNTKSCSCLRKEVPETRIKYLTNQKFGRLTALKISSKDKNGNYKWECICDCGNPAEVYSSNLVRMHTTSCSCFHKEQIGYLHTTHGQARKGNETREYNIWLGMLQRCNSINNQAYKDYGGRDIKVCDRWVEAFENFYEDMGECPEGMSIDRIDNDRGYYFENCKWSTKTEQANNTRSNVWVEYRGERKTIAEWARVLNIKSGTLCSRLSHNWSIERAFTTPVKGKE